MATTAQPTTEAPARTHVFDRVLVGVDSVRREHRGRASGGGARRALRPAHAARRLSAAHEDGRRVVRYEETASVSGAEDAVAKALAAINSPRRPRARWSRAFTWSTLIAEASEHDDHAYRRREPRPGPSRGHRQRLHDDRARPQGAVLRARRPARHREVPAAGRGGSRRLARVAARLRGRTEDSSTASGVRSGRSSRRAASTSTSTRCRN